MEERPLDYIYDAVSRRHAPRHMGPTQQLYHDASVTGVNRHKYFKRPLRQCLHRGMPPEVLFAPGRPGANEAGASPHPTAGISSNSAKRVSIQEPTGDELGRGGAGGSRTIGTQSMYRESDAQTDPYTADYYVATERDVEPEVLSLTHLSYAEGTLPAGLPEIEAIERARARRQFEAELPPVSDGPHALEQRRRMLQLQETEDLNRRESELASMQNARFEMMRAELAERERAIEEDHRERVERFARSIATELDRDTASIHGRRIKAKRRVLKERVALDTSLAKKPSIIDKYADYGSKVYAPVARDGRPLGEQLRVPNPLRASVAGLTDVENRFRHHFTVSPDRMRAPHVVAKKYRSRKGQKLAAILDYTLSQFDEERRTMQSQRAQKHSDSSLSDRAHSSSSARMRMIAERDEAQRAKVIEEVIAPLVDEIVDLAHRTAEFDPPEIRRQVSEILATENEKKDAVVASILSETLQRLEMERERAADVRRIEELVSQAERTRTRREAEESGRRQRDGFEPEPEDWIDIAEEEPNADVDAGESFPTQESAPAASGTGAEVAEAVSTEDTPAAAVDSAAGGSSATSNANVGTDVEGQEA